MYVLEWSALLGFKIRYGIASVLEGGGMPVVFINMVEGRSVEQKRAMTKAITKALVDTIGCSSESVHIIISDMKQENAAVGGELVLDRRRRR